MAYTSTCKRVNSSGGISDGNVETSMDHLSHKVVQALPKKELAETATELREIGYYPVMNTEIACEERYLSFELDPE